MKLSEWAQLQSPIRKWVKKKKRKTIGPDHIAHRHWKKPPKKSRRLRLRARRWRMQLLSRRRNHAD